MFLSHRMLLFCIG
ncbi:hypothetical protein LINPERHAP1_LOCUS12235 [Linum perenne]